MTRRWSALAFAALLACGHDKPRPVPPPPPQLPDTSRGRHVTASAPEWYWEPVEPKVIDDSKAKVFELPLAADAIARVEGAGRVWDDLGDVGRERLRKDAVVVLSNSEWRLGAFYTDLRERRVPYVLTVDALHALAHHALVRALGEIEDRELAPLLDALLAKLDTRLAAEARGAGSELVGPYRLARGVVAVARALADGAYVPSPDLATVVENEKSKIEAHATWETSPLLGVTIDYARFAVPAAAAHKGSARALGWLAAAPFSLVAKTEVPGAPLDVGAVRHHARAAMLLARLAEHDVDAQIHGAFARISRLLAFVWGSADDFGPLDLGDLAAAVKIDLAKAETIANVARVDQLRVHARTTRAPALWDGSGGVGSAGTSMRVFGAHAAIDSVALAAGAKEPRALPTTLDLANWFVALDLRPPQLHASLHGSSVDALLTWASSKTSSPVADRARQESVLAAWTLARCAGRAFLHPKPTAAPPSTTRELRVSGAPLLSFVEPEPDAIGRIVATLRQARRGLAVLGPLAKAGSADALLAEVEDIAHVAMDIAVHEANDEPLGADSENALAALPSRLAAIDSDDTEEPGPRAVVIHSDPASHRALVSATGAFEPAVVLMKEPGTGRTVLAVGAHLSHFEGIEPTNEGEGAASQLERKLKEMPSSLRAAWTTSFRVTR